MFEQLLELSARVAAEGNYEAAYHLLMAALHWVDRSGDPSGLERLAAMAKRQGVEVEALDPPHHLSRKHADMRGQTALFDSFLSHVEAVRLRMASARQLARHDPG